MYNSYQKCLCLPVDTTVKYTTSYILHPHDDSQQYLVFQDYHLDLVPGNVAVELRNLFNGNKVLGELASWLLQNMTKQVMKTENVYLCVSGNEVNKYLNNNIDTLVSEVGPTAFDGFSRIIHTVFSQAAATVPNKDIFNNIE
jgi:hypothetical protein